MSDPPAFSIVTACFRDAPALTRTGTSIAQLPAAQRERIEWIVIDGSDSREVEAATVEIAQRVSDLRVVYVGEADEGVYDAMNKGARLAGASYVQFLNSGDAFMPHADLRTLLARIEEGPLWIVCRAWHGRGTGTPAIAIPNLPHRWLRHALGMQPHCHQACWFRTRTLLDLGGYRLDLDFVADHRLIMQFGAMAHPAAVDDFLVFYEGGGVSAVRGDEIPGLLASSRAPLMADDSLLERLDALYVRLQRLTRRLRRSISLVRLHASLRRS